MFRKILGIAAIIVMIITGYRYFITTGTDRNVMMLVFIAMICVLGIVFIKEKKEIK